MISNFHLWALIWNKPLKPNLLIHHYCEEGQPVHLHAALCLVPVKWIASWIFSKMCSWLRLRILEDLKETCLTSWDGQMLTKSMVWGKEKNHLIKSLLQEIRISLFWLIEKQRQVPNVSNSLDSWGSFLFVFQEAALSLWVSNVWSLAQPFIAFRGTWNIRFSGSIWYSWQDFS